MIYWDCHFPYSTAQYGEAHHSRCFLQYCCDRKIMRDKHFIILRSLINNILNKNIEMVITTMSEIFAWSFRAGYMKIVIVGILKVKDIILWLDHFESDFYSTKIMLIAIWYHENGYKIIGNKSELYCFKGQLRIALTMSMIIRDLVHMQYSWIWQCFKLLRPIKGDNNSLYFLDPCLIDFGNEGSN